MVDVIRPRQLRATAVNGRAPHPTPWWREAVFYQVYPRSFADSSGSGVGDIRGIIGKLDYLKDLGVDCVWLSPIFKSPNEDMGYDVSDYRDINEEMGTLDDVDELIAACHDRGMRLILDLVVNHTSDRHDWFLQVGAWSCGRVVVTPAARELLQRQHALQVALSRGDWSDEAVRAAVAEHLPARARDR
jgi:oligo-1,6-glucosidase